MRASGGNAKLIDHLLLNLKRRPALVRRRGKSAAEIRESEQMQLRVLKRIEAYRTFFKDTGVWAFPSSCCLSAGLWFD